MPLSLPSQTYQHDAPTVSVARLINVFAEPQPKEALSRMVLIGTPGIREWATVGPGPIRGMIEMGGLLYVVSGTELWTITSGGTKVLKGSGISGSATVSMAQNGFEIVIVNGVNVFSYLLSADTLIHVTVVGAYAADTVTLLNQYFILEKKGFNQFYISGVLDGRSYDVLDFVSAETNPDVIIAVMAYSGLLYAFGGTSMELWNHTGASRFPFAYISGATINRGLASSKALAAEDNALWALGDDLVFYAIRGQGMRRVSTFALEQAWRKYGTTGDAFCFSVMHSGHKIIYLTFPTENQTFGYDIATGLWHERASYDYTEHWNRWRASNAINIYDLALVGDAGSNRIGVLDSDTYTEFGDPMVARIVTPPLYDGGRLISVKSIHLEMQTGVGTATGQGSDPQVGMRYSTDDGQAWTGTELASIGKMGQRGLDVFWTGLGSSERFAFEFMVSDPVKRIFTGLYLNRPKK